MDKKSALHTETRAAENRFAVAALVISIMAVIFSLALGPRLRGTEREQARLQAELRGVRQEIAALRQDLAQARAELQAVARPGAAPGAAERPEVQVTDADGAAVPEPDMQQLRARVAILDARHTRLTERLNRLVRDLKTNGVDLGITDPGR